MSVAIGTPQPRAAVPPPASARKIKAGSTAPPNRRRDGEGGPAERGKLADQDLALDLEADDQEEDGHQAIVDPVEERLRQVQATEIDGELGPPQVGVCRRQRRVRPQQRERCSGDEEHAARGACSRELAKRSEQAVHRWRCIGRHRPTLSHCPDRRPMPSAFSVNCRAPTPPVNCSETIARTRAPIEVTRRTHRSKPGPATWTAIRSQFRARATTPRCSTS